MNESGVMDTEYAQLVWRGCVDQAVQDIRLLVDLASNLQYAISDAERATAAVQFHDFGPNVDPQELVRTAGNMKATISHAVGSVQSALRRAIDEVTELEEQADNHVRAAS